MKGEIHVFFKLGKQEMREGGGGELKEQEKNVLYGLTFREPRRFIASHYLFSSRADIANMHIFKKKKKCLMEFS